MIQYIRVDFIYRYKDEITREDTFGIGGYLRSDAPWYLSQEEVISDILNYDLKFFVQGIIFRKFLVVVEDEKKRYLRLQGESTHHSRLEELPEVRPPIIKRLRR
ncbi:MAG: hypothetical protein LBH40_01520 [Alphaproteobacteria bacterium]|jgi:hypothetical protein|nr:hypothetical protein [Alphaproteobacteria bacterium]